MDYCIYEILKLVSYTCVCARTCPVFQLSMVLRVPVYNVYQNYCCTMYCYRFVITYTYMCDVHVCDSQSSSSSFKHW